jgi:hypothetical protein
MDVSITNTCLLSCNPGMSPLTPIRKNITLACSLPIESLDKRVEERIIDSDRWPMSAQA